MATYVIGDIQGCFDELMRLLQIIDFNEMQDQLWFVGDLVNRGPQSLATLRFIKNLNTRAIVVLGNHDLHLLATYFEVKSFYTDDTIQEVIHAADAEELIDWLRQQKLVHYDPHFDVVMVHAGIAPQWTLQEALNLSAEVEAKLRTDDQIRAFLENMYGNAPNCWDQSLQGWARLRVITNYFTRMRFCDLGGRLLLNKKTDLADCPPGYFPWFGVPDRKLLKQKIVFGHWSALAGKTDSATVFALDTGVIWGGPLTALRLDDFKRFSSVSARPSQPAVNTCIG